MIVYLHCPGEIMVLSYQKFTLNLRDSW